jgi:hypothetical protein
MDTFDKTKDSEYHCIAFFLFPAVWVDVGEVGEGSRHAQRA